MGAKINSSGYIYNTFSLQVEVHGLKAFGNTSDLCNLAQVEFKNTILLNHASLNAFQNLSMLIIPIRPCFLDIFHVVTSTTDRLFWFMKVLNSDSNSHIYFIPWFRTIVTK